MTATTTRRLHAGASIPELVASAEEYELITRTGFFATGEAVTSTPELTELAAFLAAVAVDLRAELARRCPPGTVKHGPGGLLHIFDPAGCTGCTDPA